MLVSPLTRVATPLRLALRRVWSRRGRAALAALGAAAGAALLATVLAAALTVSDRTIARGISSLPGAERQVAAVWGGVPLQQPRGGFASLDRLARKALTPVLGREPTTFALFRETKIGGANVDLAAADDVAHWVKLSSGRLPRTCTPGRCEVVQLAGSGPIPTPLRPRRPGLARVATALRLPAGPGDGRLDHRAGDTVAPAGGSARSCWRPAWRTRAGCLSCSTTTGAIAGSSRSSRATSTRGTSAASTGSWPRRRSAVGAVSCAFTVEAPQTRTCRNSAQPARQDSGGSCCSAAKLPRCSWRSSSWPPRGCVGTRRQAGAA